MIIVKFERTLTNAYGLVDNYVMPYNAPTYTTITGKILKDDIEIGNLTMYELDGSVNLGDMSLQIPGDVAVIADAICNNDGTLKYKVDKVALLDQIYIEPEYRGNGYGTIVVKDLITMLNDACNNEIDMIVLYASIFDIDEYISAPIGKFEKDVARLVSFYERAGFTQMENNVMLMKKG